ncbi:MAG: crossover junction endodeoxyribonuclease RuvC, partial [Cyanobacteria bacterium]|nr:crossover junction endodeoxyribonuclease RuvC [Cyanobacteriota bacterium]
MKILGIDPGLATVGFGLIHFTQNSMPSASSSVESQWGVISTSKDKSDSERLQEIFLDLSALLKEMTPDVVVIEKIFFFKNAKTLVPVSQARGVILLAIQLLGIPIFEYTPMQVKQAITGYGKSDKKEMQARVQQLLYLEKI